MNNSEIRVKIKRSYLNQKKLFFTPRTVVNVLIVYKLDTWSKGLNADDTLKDCLFGAVKLIKNTNPDKYSYSGYGIIFYCRSLFSFPNFDWGENAIIF